jgi:prepilin-type N-terminal cleavage/methylation domain-containing protein
MMTRKKRPGFTLLEVLTVIVISAGMFLGFIILLVDVAEQMHISWQVREAEEWGNWYVNEFVDKMRNGTEVDLIRITTPGEAEVTYYTSKDYGLPESLRVPKVYEFEYNYDTGFPQIRIDDVPYHNQFFPPEVVGVDDFYWVDPESFEITISERGGIEDDEDILFFDPHYMTIRFDLVYEHTSITHALYSKRLSFEGSAFVFNDRWPVIKAPGEVEE